MVEPVTHDFPQRHLTDSWLFIRKFLTPFRPTGCNVPALEANEIDLESNRVAHANTLMKYIGSKGYTIHPNTASGLGDIFGLDDPWRSKRIVIPRHVMTPNPNEDISNKQLILRRDIPILYFLTGIAHEASHLNRGLSDITIASFMDKSLDSGELQRESIPFELNTDRKIKSDYLREEAETDTQAYFLLGELGIIIRPENYCSYVGRGLIYQSYIYESIKTK